MDPGPLELRIFNGGSRWLLQPFAVIEVWTGAALVGSISGRTLTRIVEHHLAAAALAAGLQHELAAPAPRPIRRPPQAMIPADQRAQRRAQRRSRRR